MKRTTMSLLTLLVLGGATVLAQPNPGNTNHGLQSDGLQTGAAGSDLIMTNGGPRGVAGPVGDMTGGCCLPEKFCVEVTETQCDGLGGSFLGAGVPCVQPDNALAAGRHRLSGRPFLGEADAGLILSELKNDPGNTYVFRFDAPGADVYMDYTGSVVRIFGLAYGGRIDGGGVIDPATADYLQIEFAYTQAISDGAAITAPGDAYAFGYVRWQASGITSAMENGASGLVVTAAGDVDGDLSYYATTRGDIKRFNATVATAIPTCAVATGACCIERSCVDVPAVICDTLSGTYQGDGSDCAGDADGDTNPDACDMCPGSDDYADCDGDWIPDGCEPDSDGDGIPDDCDEATGACCLPDDTCIDTTPQDCDNKGGDYEGDGTSCPALGASATYRLINHPFFNLAPPPAGLRFDGLLDDTSVYSFDLEAPGSEMYMTYDGTSIRIYGVAFGGRDIGDGYDPAQTGLLQVDFEYSTVGTAPGDDDLFVSSPEGTESGTIKWLPTGETFDLVNKNRFTGDDGPFSFRFGDESDDLGHRGHPGLSGWGWMRYTDRPDLPGFNDWFFAAVPMCVEPQACCFDDGSCEQLVPMECEFRGGQPQGEGSDCADNPCDPTGACCLDDGTCVDTTREDCRNQGGSYQGDGTDCGTVDCPTNGACCLDDGTCVETTEEDCRGQGGAYSGDGTECDDVDCDPTGACCLDDSTCVETTEEDCRGQGGAYSGDGTECDDVDCDPTGACCLDDGTCVEISEEDCASEGGDYSGDGTECDDVQCDAPVCDLTVTLQGCVILPPMLDYECDKPIETLRMEWQGGVAVRVVAWKGPVGSTQLADIDNVAVGDVVTVNGYTGSPNDVYWEVFLAGTSSKIGESKFHLSCSDDEMDGPEDCGMPQGNGKGNDAGLINDWRLYGIVDEGGVLMCVQDPNNGDCVTEIPQRGDDCDGKVVSLTMQYTGEDCSATVTSQPDDKTSCSGDPADASPVLIRVTDKSNPDDDGGRIYFEGMVALGASFEASADNADRDEFGSETWVHVFGPGGVLQSVEFHTSCSKPLRAGDQYGSLLITEMVTTEGGLATIGAEVEYTYTIRNNAALPVTNVTVIDDVYGEVPGSPIASVGPGETVRLTLTADVAGDLTNTVTVSGLLADGESCDGMDSTTITREPPPEVRESCCEDGKLMVLTMLYTGEDCTASDNTQNPDKTSCSGNPMMDPLVYIRASNKDEADDDGARVWFEGEVALGTTFSLDARMADQSHLSSETWLHIFDEEGGDLLQTIEFHTSCSQPLGVNDQFGSALVVDCIGEDAPIPGDCCADGKPRVLVMRYTGDDCVLNHWQDDSKVSCSGDAEDTPLVFIRGSNKDDADDDGARVWFSGEVALGDTFALDATAADQSHLSSETHIHVFDAATGELLQQIEFHTSCSQPLAVGNQFGSALVVDCIGEDAP